jgi:hypothetical protein
MKTETTKPIALLDNPAESYSPYRDLFNGWAKATNIIAANFPKLPAAAQEKLVAQIMAKQLGIATR